jgi:hypothetical protein
MAEINVRKLITDTLKPLLPRTWRVLDRQPNLDTLSKPTVTIRIERIERAKEAPKVGRWYHGVLRITSPVQDIDRVDDALDDNIIDLLNAIDDLPATDTAPQLVWTTAERGVVEGSTNFAFDISFAMFYRKEPTNG